MTHSSKLDRGVALFNAGDFAAAAKVFEDLLAEGEDPEAALFLRHAREALRGEGPRTPKDVVDVFVAAAAGDPAAFSAAARRLFRRDRLAGARVMRDLWVAKKDGAFARGRAEASRSPWTLFARASLEWDARRDSAALSLLERAARGPETAWMRYYAAEILTRRLDRFAEALAEIETTARKAPWLWEAPCLRAELKWTLGASAGEALAPLAKSDSRLPPLLAWRGALKMWMGRPADALDDLDAAVAAGQHDASCWRGGARALLGRLAEARRDLDELLARDPDDPEALVWRGEVLRRLGRRADARRDLERALALSDAAIWAWANLALLELDEKRTDAARACFARLQPPSEIPPALDARRLRAELNAALAAAGGVRRSDAHLNRAWMAAAGANPPLRPAPDERLRAWFAFRAIL